MAKSSVSLKLLIDTEAKRVLFAEASNDGVELLFHILSLPLAKVISLLGKQHMVGSVANLYEGLENLNDSYINQNQTRDTILNPPAISDHPLLATTNDNNKNKKIKNNDPPPPPTPKRYYRCFSCFYRPVIYFSDDPSVACRNCRQAMGSANMEYVAPPGQVPSTEGTGQCLLKGVVSYMVLDDLVVRPMSSVSCIALLNELGVKDIGALQEKVIHLGKAEAVRLLKASLETRNVLTNVFLNENYADLGCPTAASEEQPPVIGKRRRRSVGSTQIKDESTSSVEEVSRPQRRGVRK